MLGTPADPAHGVEPRKKGDEHMEGRATYVHGGKDRAAERKRLDLLASLLDEESFDVLGRLGDLEGFRCLEVGAGTGTVAAWLAQRVGSAGQVVAIDLDTSHLGWLPADVEVRQHDVTAADLEGGPFQLVHCRAVLVHLPDPLAALERMAAALAPGGWLVVEEPDQTAFGSADPSHPAAATFDRVVHQMLRALQGSKRSDQYLGRRIPGLLRRIGFVDAVNHMTATVEVGGSPFAEVLRSGAADLRAALGSTVDIDDEDFAAVMEAFEDPTFPFVRLPIVRTWGRRSVLHT